MVPVERGALRGRSGLEPETETCPRGAPPGRGQDPEPGLFQNRGAVAEEGEDAGGVGRLARWCHVGERRAERRYEPGGPAESTEELFVGVGHMALQGGELGTIGPHGGSGDEQARVVDRL